MLVGGFAHEPSPTMQVVLPGTTGCLDDFATMSSLLILMSLLVAGEVEDNGKRAFSAARLVCSSPSILVSLSIINLSPASSFIPGSL